MEKIQIGDKCPTCFMEITEANIESVKSELSQQIVKTFSEGKDERGKLTELQELDSKSHEKFIEFKDADIKKVKQQISELENVLPDNRSFAISRIAEIDRLLKYGSLSEEEYGELYVAERDVDNLKSRLEELRAENNEEVIKSLLEEQTELSFASETAEETIKAVQEYVCKRAEISLSGLKMPNVKIKLFEIIKTTGELKSCFKFLYKSIDYPALSLSEKIKAGLEVTAMLRELTGVDYPVFIDNSESIGTYDAINMPSQILFMKFVKGAELSVKTRKMPEKSEQNKIPKAA